MTERRSRILPFIWPASARAVALFLGGFAELNIVGEFLRPGFDANYWWMDLHPVPAWMGRVLLGLAGLFLIAYAVRPQLGARRRVATLLFVGGSFAVALLHTALFYVLLASGEIRSGFPVPFSLFVAAAMATIGTAVRNNKSSPTGRRELFAGAISLAACMIAFPAGQVFCFGKTAYARHADAVVVFGCLVYADGQPSQALMDRVRTGCELYREGLASTLILSGGPGMGAVCEPEAMRRLAVAMGVPDGAIVIDDGGINTRSTVSNTCALFDRLGANRVLAVSHFYHLPRIKMSYRRLGREVHTVPARQTGLTFHTSYNVCREVPAFWLYYVWPPSR